MFYSWCVLLCINFWSVHCICDAVEGVVSWDLVYFAGFLSAVKGSMEYQKPIIWTTVAHFCSD